MTNRTDLRARLRTVAVTLCCLLPVGGAMATDDTALIQLFSDLQKNRSATASFQEKRYVAALKRPQELSGKLAFVAPARVEKTTESPRREKLVVERGELTIDDFSGRGPRKVALSDHPALAAMVESIRATLAGDLAALKRHYTLQLETGGAGWSLTLSPTDTSLAEMVREVRFQGRQADINRIEFVEASGDRSVMTITPLAP